MKGVQTLLTPRHFRPKTLWHHRDGTEMSSSSTGSEVSIRHFGTTAECLQLGHFLQCDLSKNEQSYALYTAAIGLPNDENSDHRMTIRNSKPFTTAL